MTAAMREGLFRRFVEGAHELTYKERAISYTVFVAICTLSDQDMNC